MIDSVSFGRTQADDPLPNLSDFAGFRYWHFHPRIDLDFPRHRDGARAGAGGIGGNSGDARLATGGRGDPPYPARRYHAQAEALVPCRIRGDVFERDTSVLVRSGEVLPEPHL